MICPPFQLKQAQQEKEPGYYVCTHVADKEITLSLMTQYLRQIYTSYANHKSGMYNKPFELDILRT